MREYIEIVSKDGVTIKKIPKDEYPLYAQGGWKEYKDKNITDRTSPLGGLSYTAKKD